MLRQTSELDADGLRTVVCDACGFTRRTHWPVERIHHVCVNPNWPRFHEWGHWLALLFAACFITKRRYLWVKRKAGLSPTCNCGEREESLNQAGASLAGVA